MPFQKGHKLAKGGARENSGPPKEEIRLKFQKMLEDSGAHKRFQDILEKTDDEELFLKAYQISLDRAWGKPIQEVKPVDDKGNYAPFQVFIPAQVSGQAGRVE